MSHTAGSQHLAENGRSDDGAEFSHQRSPQTQPVQSFYYTPQFSPVIPLVPPAYQPPYQPTVGPYPAAPFPVSLQFANFIEQPQQHSHQQHPHQQHQHPQHPHQQHPHQQHPHQQHPHQQHPHQQHADERSPNEASTPGAYSVSDQQQQQGAGAIGRTYAQAAHDRYGGAPGASAPPPPPGRGMPGISPAQPGVMLSSHQQPQHHHHQQQQQQEPQRGLDVTPSAGQQLVMEFLPAYLSEVNAEKLVHDVNPATFIDPHPESRFFVIKSYSEEDVHRAIKYSVWCSSTKNNDTLNKSYHAVSRLAGGASSNANSAASTPSSTNADPDEPPQGSAVRCPSPAFDSNRPMVYLFFSVNGSGHFCGVSRLASHLYPERDATVWCQPKWTGLFYIRWLYVKDVPNAHLRHIRIEVDNNGHKEQKPVTNTRDCQCVDFESGVKVLKVIHHFQYTTTLFDDYDHYDRLEVDKYQRLKQNQK